MKQRRWIPFLLLLVCLLPLTALAQSDEEVPKAPGIAEIRQKNIIFGQDVPDPQVFSETNDSVPWISYKIQGAEDREYQETPPTAVGVYTVRVIYPETKTHLSAQATCDFTIRAYVTKVTLDRFPQVPSRPYNGSTMPVPVAVTRLPLSFTVEGTSQVPRQDHDFMISSLKLTDPGVNQDPESLNALLELQFEDGLYVLAPDIDLKFSFHADITPAPLTITALDQYTKSDIQTGTDQAMVRGLAPSDTLQDLELSVLQDTIVPSGARIFRGDLEVTDQYRITYVPGTRIPHASISQVPAGAEGLFYDGTFQALLAFPGEADRGSLFYRVSYQSSQTGAPELISDWSRNLPAAKAPGIYTIACRAQQEDLDPSEETGLTVILAPKVLTVTASAEKVYDGTVAVTPEMITVSLDPSQVISGEEVTIRSIEGSRFPGADAGSSLKMEPGNVILGGQQAENYTVMISSYTGTIHPREVTLTPQCLQKSYGQKDPEFSYQSTGLPEGGSLRGTPGRTAGEEPGKYSLTKGTLESAVNPNYRLKLKPGTLTIVPASLSLSMKVSPAHPKPGQTVTVTITARNAEENLLSEGWRQPRGLTLTVGDQTLVPEYQGDGIYRARVQIPADGQQPLIFRAAVRDSFYEDAEVTETLSYGGASAFPKDHILLYGGLMLLTGPALMLLLMSHGG